MSRRNSKHHSSQQGQNESKSLSQQKSSLIEDKHKIMIMEFNVDRKRMR